MILYDQWNKEKEQWIGKEPTDRYAAKVLKGMVTAESQQKSKANLAYLVLKWKNPNDIDKMADIANGLVDEMNFNEQEIIILDARRNILFLEKELENTDIISSKTILYSMIEQEMRTVMLANIRDESVFRVIEPAFTPAHAEEKPFSIIIFIGMMLGLMSGSFTAIIIRYFKIKQL